MLNTIVNKSTTTFNSPASGIIQKSNKDSFFSTFHYNSERAKDVFKEAPKYKEKSVIVLQILLCNDGYVLTELIYSDKF